MNNDPASIDGKPQAGTYPSRVLVIEKNDDSRYLLKTYLEIKGYKVVEVENDDECFALIPAFLPDLIILNITLPIMDGLVTLQRMRNHELLRTIPVIVTSAHTVRAFQEEVLRSGGKAFFAKPIHFDSLVQAIKQCLPSPDGRH